MNRFQLADLFRKLHKAYHCGWSDGQVDMIDQLIFFISKNKDFYPDDVRQGVERSLFVFKELRDRSEKRQVVDRDKEWKLFMDTYHDLAYRVLNPWLNKGSDVPFVFIGMGVN